MKALLQAGPSGRVPASPEKRFLINNRRLAAGALVALALATGLAWAAERIEPTTDLVYAGAFRLPGGSGGTSWEWGGRGLAYCPDGDPGGDADGYPGTLYGIGHDHLGHVSQIGIPTPVVSPGKDVADLQTATTLRPFQDARAFNPGGDGEWLLGDLAVLPAQGSQSNGKLHQCWIRHQQDTKVTQLGWSALDLSSAQGGWYLGPADGHPGPYYTGRYLCVIPEEWAAAHTPGLRLANGRFRDGGQASCGPSLYAYAPWQQGNPPAPNTAIPFATLLEYENFEGEHWMEDYTHADDWVGVEWMTTADGRTAVVFVGTKGLGEAWYGYQNGARFPDCLPECNEWADRGWWSDQCRARLMFYDPDDLAAVAAGTLEPHIPQPYAVLDVDERLFVAHAINDKNRFLSSAFDPDNGNLYVLEPWADGDQPIVHVWTLRQAPTLSFDAGPAETPVRLTMRNLAPDVACEVQAATSLVRDAWSAVHSFSSTGSVHVWEDTGTADMSSRYYRLRLP